LAKPRAGAAPTFARGLSARRSGKRASIAARAPAQRVVVGVGDERRVGLAEAETAKQPAPVPDDLGRRAADVKGCGYFMNASQIGICRIPDNAWCVGATKDAHAYAVVILVEYGRVPEVGNLARDWIAPAEHEAAEMRATEIAVCLARHIRAMGFAARADVPGRRKLDHARLAVLAGVAWRRGNGAANPYVGERFALAVVSSDYALATDLPLAETGPRRTVSATGSASTAPPRAASAAGAPGAPRI
jgi:hypothetical protein